MRDLVDESHGLDVRPVVDGGIDPGRGIVGTVDVQVTSGVFDVPGIVVADVVDGSEGALGPVHGRHVGDAQIAFLAIVVVGGDAGRVWCGGERVRGGSCERDERVRCGIYVGGRL